MELTDRCVNYSQYFHCFCHKLNLSVTDAASDSLPAIDRAYGRINATAVFFKASNQRLQVLSNAINLFGDRHEKQRFVPLLCPTRWVDRHRTLRAFKKLFVPISHALNEISVSNHEAEGLLLGMSRFSFVFILVVRFLQFISPYFCLFSF